MEKKDFELILNHWKIYDENERWSLESLFLNGKNETDFTVHQFSDFIAKQKGKEHPEGPLPE